jgi:SPP1 family predicted phage head-tail adaptor
MIRAGTLKHLLTIETPSTTTNEYREEIQTWTTLLSTRASIKPLRGKETYINQTKDATATHLVTFRYQIDITPIMRVRFNDRLFNITSVINVEESNKVTQLLVEEAQNV